MTRQVVFTERNTSEWGGKTYKDRTLHSETWNRWLRLQNGALPTQPAIYDPVRCYIRNGRDLADWVHLDYPVQSSLNAALLLARMGDEDSDPKSSPLVFDELNPYNTYRKQEPFATLGSRLRLEEYGGRVHNTLTGMRQYPVPQELLSSPVLPLILARNSVLNGGAGGTYLLNQAFPEGSPIHPAYGSGHSTHQHARAAVSR